MLFEFVFQAMSLFPRREGGDPESKFCNRNSCEIKRFDILLIQPGEDCSVAGRSQRFCSAFSRKNWPEQPLLWEWSDASGAPYP